MTQTAQLDAHKSNRRGHTNGAPHADTGPTPIVVRGIIALAHQLEREVIAEGVETAIEYDLFRKMGCDVVLGYLLGRTLSPAAFADAYFGKASSEGSPR